MDVDKFNSDKGNTESVNKKRIYQPPPAHVIEQYVRKICQSFAQTDETIDSPEVIWGFTEFVKVVSAITARKLNECTQSSADLVDKANQPQ